MKTLYGLFCSRLKREAGLGTDLFLVVHKSCGAFLSSQRTASTPGVLCPASPAGKQAQQEGAV